uniref:Uncharacterized protein n=1 Tax=Grammatophora oceanica TaxID=210454 RepID=A0A7S1YKD7_9STRA|mmetsp:Transcript_51540/g.76900  ORF Transcript_51540/g.76900 Transcript_51540/m.76900 type:complete len:770 (+) Transcript_51540:464-2773(+)|eukprot:CAMPEP_0194038122 /NCGR_PEP_ID=MMETSP0009_2-20130614/10381_1 /TAXON_ID=210454 /ORGANISM="Grammatophora oceanica, Strain CCMP 410" /LENGTH=769 /DNA_ID=CAMNT_0038680523 /DNA_START=451 /DNA_END=2760 /DNA_ORIENTATION=+
MSSSRDSLMAGSVPTFGHRSSQYCTGDLESDDDGIPVVDGMSLSYDSGWGSQEDGIPVIYAGGEVGSLGGSDDDGMSASLGSGWQSFPLYLGVESNLRSPSKKKGLLPMIVLTSNTEESSSLAASSLSSSWSSSSCEEEDDHGSMSNRIISNIDALRSFWGGGEPRERPETKRRRSLSPSLSSPTLETDGEDLSGSSGDLLTSVNESDEGSCTLSSSAAAPYAASDDSWFAPSDHNRCRMSVRYGSVPTVRSLTESSSSSESSASSPPTSSAADSCGLSSKEEVDSSVAPSLDPPPNTQEKMARHVYPSKSRLTLDTEKISEFSTAGLESNISSATYSSSVSGRPKQYESPHQSGLVAASLRSKCRRRVCFITLFLAIFTVVAIGTLLGVELWSVRSQSSPATTGQPSSAPTSPTSTGIPDTHVAPLTLNLLFRQRVPDVEAVAIVLVKELARELSTIPGFSEVQLSMAQVPDDTSVSPRSRQKSNVMLVGRAIFEDPTSDDVVDFVYELSCGLLTDVDKLQRALVQQPTLKGVVYEGTFVDDCDRDIFTSPDGTQEPSASPSQTTPMPTPWTRPPKPTVAPTDLPTPQPSSATSYPSLEPTEAPSKHSAGPSLGLEVTSDSPSSTPKPTPWSRPPQPTDRPTRTPPTSLTSFPSSKPSQSPTVPHPSLSPVAIGSYEPSMQVPSEAPSHHILAHWTLSPVSVQLTMQVTAPQAAPSAPTASPIRLDDELVVRPMRPSPTANPSASLEPTGITRTMTSPRPTRAPHRHQ